MEEQLVRETFWFGMGKWSLLVETFLAQSLTNIIIFAIKSDHCTAGSAFSEFDGRNSSLTEATGNKFADAVDSRWPLAGRTKFHPPLLIHETCDVVGDNTRKWDE